MYVVKEINKSKLRDYAYIENGIRTHAFGLFSNPIYCIALLVCRDCE